MAFTTFAQVLLLASLLFVRAHADGQKNIELKYKEVNLQLRQLATPITLPDVGVTLGPDPVEDFNTGELLGFDQGICTYTETNVAQECDFSFIFFDGSSFTVTGRFETTGDLAVVGGTGNYTGATGVARYSSLTSNDGFSTYGYNHFTYNLAVLFLGLMAQEANIEIAFSRGGFHQSGNADSQPEKPREAERIPPPKEAAVSTAASEKILGTEPEGIPQPEEAAVSVAGDPQAVAGDSFRGVLLLASLLFVSARADGQKNIELKYTEVNLQLRQIATPFTLPEVGTTFGTISYFNDPFEDFNTGELLGFDQGICTWIETDVAQECDFSFIFYDGSSFTVTGRFETTGDLAVVGGTGNFTGATGVARYSGLTSNNGFFTYGYNVRIFVLKRPIRLEALTA
ncbi:Allene oxide cyclase [Klebsormidium nitens]|uniref:Dirigent protein n=1 Tax=Klebsormidium nitens TaxID=105231 RepID=A0A1Y1HPV5_KLENI|nr:Allene oxide cyclase [Klebsormidium nitens]|eukprot:GAQ79011.1 Allene oxide cyclase [Klebsormidium nitens]